MNRIFVRFTIVLSAPNGEISLTSCQESKWEISPVGEDWNITLFSLKLGRVRTSVRLLLLCLFFPMTSFPLIFFPAVTETASELKSPQWETWTVIKTWPK